MAQVSSPTAAENVVGSRIFRSPECLQPLAPPPGGQPLGRETQLRILTEVARGQFRRNILVIGKPGSGKTLCVQHVLEQIRQEGRLAVYVNAGKTRTPYFTLAELVRGLGVRVPYSGWQIARLKKEFELVLQDRDAVIAIDEADILLENDSEPVPYFLSRQPNIILIMIANHLRNIAELSERVKSTLQPVVVNFPNYDRVTAEAIIRERVDAALHPDRLAPNALLGLIEVLVSMGDVRLTYNLLLLAGRLAEHDGSTQITLQHLKAAARLIHATD